MRKTALILSLSAFAMGSAFAADPATIDWSKVPATNVPLFYPGQSSYEWLRSSDHKGATVVKNNGACAACHTGKEKAIGEKIVKGGPLEPMPVKGKNGYVDLKFQAAYDAKNAYLRFEWKTLNAVSRAPSTSTCASTARNGRSTAIRSSTRWCRTASSPASTRTACPS